MSQERMKALNDIGFVWFPRKKPSNVCEPDGGDSGTSDVDDGSADSDADDSSTGNVSDDSGYCSPTKKTTKMLRQSILSTDAFTALKGMSSIVSSQIHL
jgi:hypothetical protein